MRPHRIIITAVLLAVACAGRDAILSRTLDGLDAAQKAFVEGDNLRQVEIVQRATTREQGVADLAAYRAKRDIVAAAFVGAYTVAATASLELTEASLTQLAGAVAKAVAAMRSLLSEVIHDV